MPAVETGDESYRWRRTWVYELSTDRVRQVSAAADNVWEANWCGNDAFIAVVSPGPGEGLWYSADLRLTEIKDSPLTLGEGPGERPQENGRRQPSRPFTAVTGVRIPLGTPMKTAALHRVTG